MNYLLVILTIAGAMILANAAQADARGDQSTSSPAAKIKKPGRFRPGLE